MRKQKAFTLIELLIVIAIIGVLAGVVVVAANSSRNRSRDAAAISAANSLMKLALFYRQSDGSYVSTSGFLTSNTQVDVAGNCGGQFTAAKMPAVAVNAQDLTQIVNSCVSILTNIASAPLTGSAGTWRLWIGSSTAVTNPDISIMVSMTDSTVYCLGSNGKSSRNTMTGCGGNFTCPGCYADPSGK